MKNADASRQLQRLRAAMKQAMASTTQFELRAHWAKYFCVITAGFLENAIKAIIGDYVARTSKNPVGTFARTELQRFQNPNPEKFLQLVRGFDRAWAADIELFMADEGGKEAIDAIMNHRHNIAHGRDSQISFAVLQSYITKATAVLERLEGHFNP